MLYLTYDISKSELLLFVYCLLFTSLAEPEVLHGSLVVSSVHQLLLRVVHDQPLQDGPPLRLVDQEVVDGGQPVAAITTHRLLDVGRVHL